MKFVTVDKLDSIILNYPECSKCKNYDAISGKCMVPVPKDFIKVYYSDLNKLLISHGPFFVEAEKARIAVRFFDSSYDIVDGFCGYSGKYYEPKPNN